MISKIVDLIPFLPTTEVENETMNLIATKLFPTTEGLRFVQSNDPPEKRYGINVENEKVNMKNDYIPNFGQLGPNERYLINKFFFSTSPLLYLVGGIGVGKSRFLHFYLRHILPTANYDPSVDSSICQVYYDFLEDGCAITDAKDEDTIKRGFLQTFCVRLEAEIRSHNYFDIDSEVTEVWDEIIKEKRDEFQKSPSISFIISEIGHANVGPEILRSALEQDDKRLFYYVLDTRKKILQKIKNDLPLRLNYLALIFAYIKTRFYKDRTGWIVVIIDNIDREPSLVQQHVKHLIKPFAKISRVRTIFAARQSTYYQQLDDGFSDPPDVVAYCGPSPLHVIKSRFDRYEEICNRFSEFLDHETLNYVKSGINKLIQLISGAKFFNIIFRSLCGRSVRKSLILAQNLIYNSVYDLITIGSMDEDKFEFNIQDLIKGLIIKDKCCFEWSPDGVIENVFQVQEQPTKSYFIKIRILKILYIKRQNGIHLNNLIDILKGFGYSLSLICDAINDLKNKYKRLIWSDTLRGEFVGEEDLVKHGTSRLMISTVGEGYATTIYKSLQYIQEIMLDTGVIIDEFSVAKERDYRKINHRFELLYDFLDFLLQQDTKEMSYFIAIRNHNLYLTSFGSNKLISRGIFVSVRDSIWKILQFIIENSTGDYKLAIERLMKIQISKYNERINWIEHLESEIFE